MKRASVLLSALLSIALPATAGAADLPVDPAWDYAAADTPAVVLQTDYYIYGKRIKRQNNQSFLHLAIDPRSYEKPVTHFLYWEDRTSGERVYINETVGMSLDPIDLKGDGETLAAAPMTDKVNGMLLAGTRPGGVPDVFKSIPDDPGHYMWCYEIRDETGTKLLNRAYALYSVVKRLKPVKGSIDRDRTWSSDNAYLLEGTVTIEDGATLTVEPGTYVFGSTKQLSLLNVRPGGRLVADGTELLPIVFTSELPLLRRSRADWAGIVINGDAPVNEPEAVGEGDTGSYGGDNPGHDGGILRYVRVEYSGRIFSETNELNGLTFQGVGSGTVVDHVQVHQCSDDGIEFFGGTVNARNVLVSGCGDDSLDWTYGYTGKLQNIVLMQLYEEADCGIEGGNHPQNDEAEPRSNPVIYNATFLGLPMTNRKAAKPAPALFLKNGSSAAIHNSIFAGFGGNSVDIGPGATTRLVEERKTVVSDCIFFRNNLLADPVVIHAETVRMLVSTRNNRFFVDPGFAGMSLIKPNLAPRPGSAAADPRSITPLPKDDDFFIPADYIGGIDPTDPEGPWIFRPWTNFMIQ